MHWKKGQTSTQAPPLAPVDRSAPSVLAGFDRRFQRRRFVGADSHPTARRRHAVFAAIAAPERLRSIWQGEVAAKRYLLNSGARPPADRARPLGGQRGLEPRTPGPPD